MSTESLHVYTEVAKNIYGNSNSLHDLGTDASTLLETCRNEIASLLNGKKEGIYFTSGGTESNILALESLIQGHKEKGNHIITTEIEHSSIHNYFQTLKEKGFEITYLSVNNEGKINIEELQHCIRDTTILASIQHANSEIGVIQPMQTIGKILYENSILFHSDCVQTFGKIPIDVINMKLTSVSISSHKIYGPKGVGAVYIAPSISWSPLYPNTSHESGLRPGTVNVPGIAAFVTAAQTSCSVMKSEYEKFQGLRKQFIEGISSIHDKIEVIESLEEQIPHIIGLRLHGIEGQYAMLELNRYGIAISTGSACKVGQQAPSKTIMSVGKSTEEAKQFIRLSFGKTTTPAHIDQAVLAIKKIIDDF